MRAKPFIQSVNLSVVSNLILLHRKTQNPYRKVILGYPFPEKLLPARVGRPVRFLFSQKRRSQ